MPKSACFVIMPFGGWFDEYYDTLYAPAVLAAGLCPKRADDIYRPGSVIHDIWELTKGAEVVVADLSTKNPNVFYELGLAHAIQKPVILVTDNIDDVPFDLRHLRVIEYDKNQPTWGDELKQTITAAIVETLKNPARAILATFLEVSGKPKEKKEVSADQKDVIGLKQEIDALRLRLEETRRYGRMPSFEARNRIERYMDVGMPPSLIIDRMLKFGVPVSFVEREIARVIDRQQLREEGIQKTAPAPGAAAKQELAAEPKSESKKET